ncbi:DUF4198 domain-containing protein [Asticcacaulis endophyticus]|uniref:Nickel transporter n=1 Tax=Asticcacaulis endophyticus TaxID=1395890 RepID=A0A918UV11_9CAUL|nr:DUF4198 domain-containing protein [Asticcacaulis endophyticus]GGZ37536.1 nickel transporter [Asticcacaulis endophyticus]
MASSALAHSPYLRPNHFTPDKARKHVTVEASFAEGQIRPDVAMKSDAFNLTAPDGATTPLTPVATLKDAVLLEPALPVEGTYRISSGVRTGRVAKATIKDGKVVFGEGPASAPKAGDKVVDVQSLTRADVYVTKGAPTTGAYAKPQTGVAIQPITAPNDAYAREAFVFAVLNSGKPVANEDIEIVRDGEIYEAQKSAPVHLKTGADGKVTFTPAKTGVYLIQVRVRSQSQTKVDLWLSETATLTLEVLPQ